MEFTADQPRQARMLNTATMTCKYRGRLTYSTWAEHTNLYSVPAEPETREHHLSQSETGSKCGEVANGDDADHIEEEANEASVRESKEEEFLSEETDGEGGDDHVGRKPLPKVRDIPRILMFNIP